MGTIVDIFLQLGLKDDEVIAGGFKFQHKVRTDGGKFATLGGGKFFPTAFFNPGGIGRTDSAVGEGKTRRSPPVCPVGSSAIAWIIHEG